MASLNTLRTKFGVVLSVIIAGALLAFILSLKTEMGFSGSDPKVGEMDGTNIKYSEYYRLYEQFKSQNNVQENDEQQSAMLANAIWQTLMGKHVISPGFDDMGLQFTEAERLAVIGGQRMSQTLYNAFADPRTGEYNVAAVSQFLRDAETNPQAQAAWAQLNDQLRMEREMQKYLGLVKGGVYVNSLEVANGVAAANNTYAGQWAGKKFADMPDSLFTVSDSELKAYYKSHKDMFRQVPSRTISYVVFEVAPSEDDLLALQKKAEQVGAEFAVAENPKSFIHANSGRVTENFVSASQLSEDEAAALLAGGMYGPVLKNNEWRMSRVAATKMAPDSIGVRHIVLPYTEEVLADSLLTVLKNGGDFAQLAAQYSVYEQTAAVGGEIGVVPFSSFGGEFADALGAAKQGEVVKISSGDAIQLMQVYRADKPVQHMQIASITYPVVASETTNGQIRAEAAAFMMNASGSTEKFNDAATQAAVTPRVATVSQGERTIRGLEDSREMTRWSYGAKKNDLSEILKVGKDYVVAMIVEIDDNEFASPGKVATQLRAQVLREKKFDQIVKELSGTTLDEQAASLGSEVAPFEGINFASYYINGAGIEPRLVGAIATADKGMVSAPVKGLSGVYVFRVDDIQTTDKQTVEGEKVRAQAMTESMVEQFVIPAVQQMAEIKDLRGKYF